MVPLKSFTKIELERLELLVDRVPLRILYKKASFYKKSPQETVVLLKYQRFTPSSCKDIGIRKLKF